MNDDDQDKQDASEFTAKLLSLARTAERLMPPRAVATALQAACVCYLLQYTTEAGVRLHLRETAANLAATEPPAPTVN